MSSKSGKSSKKSSKGVKILVDDEGNPVVNGFGYRQKKLKFDRYTILDKRGYDDLALTEFSEAFSLVDVGNLESLSLKQVEHALHILGLDEFQDEMSLIRASYRVECLHNEKLKRNFKDDRWLKNDKKLLIVPSGSGRLPGSATVSGCDGDRRR